MQTLINPELACRLTTLTVSPQPFTEVPETIVPQYKAKLEAEIDRISSIPACNRMERFQHQTYTAMHALLSKDPEAVTASMRDVIAVAAVEVANASGIRPEETFLSPAASNAGIPQSQMADELAKVRKELQDRNAFLAELAGRFEASAKRLKALEILKDDEGIAPAWKDGLRHAAASADRDAIDWFMRLSRKFSNAK